MTQPLITPTQPCGCPIGEGHRCPPPWVDPDEWPKEKAQKLFELGEL